MRANTRIVREKRHRLKKRQRVVFRNTTYCLMGPFHGFGFMRSPSESYKRMLRRRAREKRLLAVADGLAADVALLQAPVGGHG